MYKENSEAYHKPFGISCINLTLKMTTARVVEMSVTVNNKNPIQDYDHRDGQTQPTHEMTRGFNPFAVLV